MAPKRRSSTGPAKASATQSTLAFHGSSNKITKPTALPRSAKSHTKIDDIPTSIKTEEPSVKAEPEVDEVIIQAPAVAVPAPSKSDKQLEAEKEARKVSEARIKKYWTAKEKTRMAPRVHQEDLSLHEKVLREWDMCGLYGPAIGIPRLSRWNRANRLNLQPPIEVLAVLLMEEERENGKVQRAYVDELMGSREVVDT